MQWTIIDPDQQLHKGKTTQMCPEWAVAPDAAAPKCWSNVDNERLGLNRGGPSCLSLWMPCSHSPWPLRRRTSGIEGSPPFHCSFCRRVDSRRGA